MKRLILAALAGLSLASPAAAIPPGQRVPVLFGQLGASAAPGTPTSLTVTTSQFYSPTDVVPLSQYVQGWTADLCIAGMKAKGRIDSASSGGPWTFGTYASPKASFTVSSKGYDSTGTLTTVNRTIMATLPLRQVFNTPAAPNTTLPYEYVSLGTYCGAVALSDRLYTDDVLTGVNATIGAGLYNDGLRANSAATVPVTGSSSAQWPRPIGVWVTEPGRYLGAATASKVEFFGAQAYGNGLKPLAAVKICAADATGLANWTTNSCGSDGTHNVSTVVSTTAASSRQLATSCTATNGSNALTACTSTLGFIPGMRLTVPGVPGQPKILSVDSSTQLTLGTTATVTLTTGTVTSLTVTNNAIPSGDGLADGLFIGSKINCANLNGGSDLTMTNDTTTAQVTVSSGKPTQAVFTIPSTAATAVTNQSCTIKHVYQGTTGAVAVTAGNPIPDYQATLNLSALSDGVITFRAIEYPVVGSVLTDTYTGADGTRCDWFVATAAAGAPSCSSSNSAWFSAAGTNVSPNLHNLWAYKDAAGTRAKKYAWVAASAGGATAVQATGADPGSTAYYGSVSAAVTALKTAYGGASANGGVVCLVATGGSTDAAPTTFAGWGASITSSFTANGAPFYITQGVSGGTCNPDAGVADVGLVAITGNATAANTQVPTNTRITNVALSGVGSIVVSASDASNNATFQSTEVMFENDWFKSTSNSSPTVYKIGTWRIYNSLIDESGFETAVLKTYAGNVSDALGLLLGSTVWGGGFQTTVAQMDIYNALGNVTAELNVRQPQFEGLFGGALTYPAPLSSVMAYNKFMLEQGGKRLDINNGSVNNWLAVNNIVEMVNNVAGGSGWITSADTNTSPAQNLVELYNLTAGARHNWGYLEGIPAINGNGGFVNASTAGGCLPAGTYYVAVSYSKDGVSESAVDYAYSGSQSGSLTIGTPTGTSCAGGAGGSITAWTPQDKTHTMMLYLDTFWPPRYFATCGGVDCKGVAANSQVTLTAIGSASNTFSRTGLPGHNPIKTQFHTAFNLFQNCNQKGDAYGGGTGASSALGNGGRVSNWDLRYGVGNMGNVCVTGSVITNAGQGNALNGMGDYPGLLTSSIGSSAATTLGSPVYGAFTGTDLSYVAYKSDRSFGGNSASVVSPATNLGQGNYCPVSLNAGVQMVPSGLAAFPTDITGAARKNDGTGYPGAYEGGCI